MQSLHPKLYLLAVHAMGLAAVGVALFCFNTLVHGPLAKQEQEHNRNSEKLKQGLRDSLEVRREHLKLTKEFEELNKTVASVRRRLPTVSIESRFLALATAAAEAQRIQLNDFRREGMSVDNGYGEVSVGLRGSGSHAAICRFLKNLHDFPHTAILTRIEINSSNTASSYPFAINYRLYHDAAGGARTADAPGPDRRR